MQQHGGCGGFAVGSAHDHPGLSLAGLLNEFRIGVHRYAQFLGTKELRIVLSSVHSQDHGVERCMDAIREPPFCFGQKTGCSKTTAAGFKNSVIAARYPGTLAG